MGSNKSCKTYIQKLICEQRQFSRILLTVHETNNYQEACKSIARWIESKNLLSVRQVLQVVREVSSMYHLPTMPKNEHIIHYLHNSQYKRLLMVKPNKTASGVAVIAVMPNPYRCPHGRCIYCPGGIKFNTPLSYTGTEPVTRAAQKFNYDPYYQVCSKMEQLQARGHDTGKTEIVIVGGTFPFMPASYQRQFAKSCYDALNGKKSFTLSQAKATNEIADNRCVGFTVETKPDYCKESHIDLMLELGITRIELGIQSLDNNVYKLTNRGCTLDDVVYAFKIARNAGYKIVAHMMPGLPGSSPEKDIEDFRQLFEDDAFKPDMLKIYPTLVMEHTGLSKMHKMGKYEPYSEDEIVDIIM